MERKARCRRGGEEAGISHSPLLLIPACIYNQSERRRLLHDMLVTFVKMEDEEKRREEKTCLLLVMVGLWEALWKLVEERRRGGEAERKEKEKEGGFPLLPPGGRFGCLEPATRRKEANLFKLFVVLEETSDY